ncbi:MAG: STAS domain-containing protein [Eubacteriales bacterium]
MALIKKYDDQQNLWQLDLSGEIDIYNAEDLKQDLHALIDEHKGDVIIDCKGLQYIDSTGLGVLVSALKVVKDYNGYVKLTSLKSHIAKIFNLTGLTKIMEIEEYKDEA